MNVEDMSGSFFAKRVKHLAESIESAERNLLRSSSLGVKDFEVLKLAYAQQAPFLISPNQILQEISITSGALSTCLGRLADKHLVLRLKAKHDQRSKPIQLTTKGRELVEQLLPELENEYRKLFDGLESVSQEALLSLTEKLSTV